MTSNFQPLGVLVKHRVDDVDKRLVAGEKAVASRQQIAFQPSLTHMFAEDFHHAAIGRDAIVLGDNLARPHPVCHLKHRIETV